MAAYRREGFAMSPLRLVRNRDEHELRRTSLHRGLSDLTHLLSVVLDVEHARLERGALHRLQRVVEVAVRHRYPGVGAQHLGHVLRVALVELLPVDITDPGVGLDDDPGPRGVAPGLPGIVAA